MSEKTTNTNPTEAVSLHEENKLLKRENVRLTRELRNARTVLENATQAMNTKDALERVLSNTNAKQRALTDMLLETCPNIIALFDEAGRFVLTTRAFLTVANIHNFDFIQNRHYQTVFSEYLDDAALEKLENAIAAVLETHTSIVIDEWIDFSKSGNNRFYSIEISTGGRTEKDKTVSEGFIAVFVDLTDIMREKQRAEDASSAKSDFLATMSHEIRTPMNAILGMSEMLSRSNLDANQMKYLTDIRKSSQSLLTIINDILDFSKVEAGRMELVTSNYCLSSLLDNLQSMFTHLFEVKKLAFRFIADQNLPTYIHGDEVRLRQIVTNLVSNALKYTNVGQVEVHAFLRDNKICFDVKDTGIGIREEDMERLFEPFEQLDLRKNKNVIGTGLGLAISYNLCKIMGGRLWLESVYGEGSTFHAEVPYLSAGDDVVESATEVTEFSAPAASILVVDDIDINLAVVEAMLGLFDIKPTLAYSGAEGVQLADTQKYDIIFMDHMMPEIDGIEATNLIRNGNGINADTIIVALTANAVNGMEAMFLMNGFDGFLSKPLEFTSLNLCLRKWLPAEYITELETPRG